ncbi:MAG: cytochrome c biogenesis protein ResB [Deltaproteobacteria bacterium]|nr:cytochrome c biogenesis protein ResB [Deltaproteobacteria bacterium]
MRYNSFTEKLKNYFTGLGDRHAGSRRFLCWSYKQLSSITTSVYLLGLMALFFMVGTIFPQGGSIDDYIKEGGGFVFFVKLFGLLDFFSSPLFLILAFIFFLNLAICTYERLLVLQESPTFPKSYEPTHILMLAPDFSNAHSELRNAFAKLKFKVVSKDDDWTVVEKGLPYKWLTWLYHLGIILCFLGFILTYLFSFEGTITLKPREAQTLVPDTTGRIQSLWKDKTGQTDFHLKLDSFHTEYAEAPELDFPKDKLSRLAIGLGWKSPDYEMKGESLTAKDWRAKIKVIKGSGTLAEQTVEINEPLEYGNYTFYLLGFEQNFRLSVEDNPILLEAKEDEDIFIPGLGDSIKFGTFRSGTLYKLDGTIEMLKPYTIVKHTGKDTDEELGRIEPGAIMEIDGVNIKLVEVEESAILSYRYDPGVGILWWGGILVLVAMALRFYGSWYRIAYQVTDTASIELNIMTRGLGSSSTKIIKSLEKHLPITKQS